MITLVVTPFILNTAVYNLRGVVNNMVYVKLFPTLKMADSIAIYTNWGVFSTQAQTIADIPIALATALGTSVIPTVAQLVVSGDKKGMRDKIRLVIKSTMLLSIPCAVGIFVLGGPITALLFPSISKEDLYLAQQLLKVMAVSLLFCELSTLNSNVLQGIGKVNRPILHSAVALVLQTAVAVGLVCFTRMDVYGIAIANTLYFILVSVLNQWAVRKATGYRQELLRTFFLPLLAAVGMGAVAWGVYQGVYLLTHAMRLAVLPAILAAVPVYFVLLLLGRSVNESELREFPKGYLLVKVAKKCRLL